MTHQPLPTGGHDFGLAASMTSTTRAAWAMADTRRHALPLSSSDRAAPSGSHRYEAEAEHPVRETGSNTTACMLLAP